MAKIDNLPLTASAVLLMLYPPMAAHAGRENLGVTDIYRLLNRCFQRGLFPPELAELLKECHEKPPKILGALEWLDRDGLISPTGSVTWRLTDSGKELADSLLVQCGYTHGEIEAIVHQAYA